MNRSVQMVDTTCWCGIPMSLPEPLYAEARHSGSFLFCPLGHQFHWDSEFEKLKKELGQVKDANQRLERQRDRALADLQRVQRRADRGVCQHCHRSFVNVERHVRTKHPQGDQ
jgi:hypothetical protein